MAAIRKRIFLVICVAILLWLLLMQYFNYNSKPYYSNITNNISLNKKVKVDQLSFQSIANVSKLNLVSEDATVSIRNSHKNTKFSQSLKPVFLPGLDEFGLVKSPEDQMMREIGYKKHAFNVLVSRNIGLFRDLPDTRHKICTKQKYSAKLQTASVIMCFFNEHPITLLRSINSVFKRTPSHLLTEIILVDDFSDSIELNSNLTRQLAEIDVDEKIHLIRNTKREGLIRARVIGARRSKGDVLIFLDSHIEVNINWIEPLLDAVLKDNSTLAVPVIDIINSDTFVYTPSPLVRGGFNWGLHFKWEELPEGTLVNETSFAGPFRSPTMAGGLFAVNREYFQHIGEYDMGMDIWGGENLEISFRVWQCGGSIKIYPCSRVGHVFRKRRPYGSPDGSNTVMRNSLRLAHVWMDDFMDFYLVNQKSAQKFDFGDIQDRIDLRKRLKCKPFSWYVNHVYPELEIPGSNKNQLSKLGKSNFQPWHLRKRKYINNFLIRLSNTTLCIAVEGKKHGGKWKRGSTLQLRPCMRVENQLWYETDKAELVLGKLFCLEASHSEGYAFPVLGKCHEMLGDQEWRHVKRNETPLYNVATGMCLRTAKSTVGSPVFLDLCSKENLNAWDLWSIV